ncbi:MAG: ABC transporter ATP-binding protein [Planctomycetota bacterium]
MSVERVLPSWHSITRGYTAGRGRTTWLMLIHFVVKEAAARFFPLFIAGAVAVAEIELKRESGVATDAAWWLTMMPWWGTIAMLTGVQIALLLWNIPGHVWYVRALSEICRGHGRELRLRVCRHLQRLSLLYHGRQSTGKIHSKIVRDIDAIESTPIDVVQPLLQAILIVIVTIAAIAISAPITAPVFLLLAPLAWAVHVRFRRRMDETARGYRETTERLSSRMQDMLQMIPVTRAHGLEEEELERAEGRIEDVRREAGRFDVVTASFAASSWSIVTIFNALFLAVMVVFSVQGLISIAEVVLFQGMFGQLTFAVMMVMGVAPRLVRLRDSCASVNELLQEPDLEANEHRTGVSSVDGAIVLSDVSFSYPGGGAPAVSDVSLIVGEGESLAIVGPSGGGKSTLLSLVLGFLRPTKGSILLDGASMSTLDMRTYRRRVAVVTQTSVFFSGTIRENLTFGTGTDDEAVERALDLANAAGFIREMPEGLETRIGEAGRSLSGGQMQRLALARALVRDPRVLLLDEPTSSLDAEADLLFREALKRVMPGRTVLMVSHSLLTARTMPRIIVLERGRIAGDGTHDQLMHGDSFYSRTHRRLEAV